jgi:hypothetical protein
MGEPLALGSEPGVYDSRDDIRTGSWFEDMPPDDDDVGPPPDDLGDAARWPRHPVLVFERVTGPRGAEVEVDYDRLPFGSPDHERVTETVRKLGEALVGAHGAALAASDLGGTFREMGPVTQVEVAAAIGHSSGAQLSRWSATWLVGLPGGTAPLSFLFCRGGQAYDKSARGLVIADVLNTLPSGPSPEDARDAVVDDLRRRGVRGTGAKSWEETLREDVAVILALKAQPDLVARARSRWPDVDPGGLVRAVRPEGRGRGVVHAWMALCGAI